MNNKINQVEIKNTIYDLDAKTLNGRTITTDSNQPTDNVGNDGDIWFVLGQGQSKTPIENVEGLQDALDEKANKTETYTKTEVDELMANAGSGDVPPITVSDSAPTNDEGENGDLWFHVGTLTLPGINPSSTLRTGKLTGGSTYTLEENGYAFCSVYAPNGYTAALVLDGVELLKVASSSTATVYMQFPVVKGQILSATYSNNSYGTVNATVYRYKQRQTMAVTYCPSCGEWVGDWYTYNDRGGASCTSGGTVYRTYYYECGNCG